MRKSPEVLCPESSTLIVNGPCRHFQHNFGRLYEYLIRYQNQDSLSYLNNHTVPPPPTPPTPPKVVTIDLKSITHFEHEIN